MPRLAVQEIAQEESVDHLFWERAAREGLMDAVGGMEWMRRMKGTEMATEEWLRRHNVMVESMENREAVVEQLLTAIVERALDPPTR
ncbi:MAG: hypothetical protein V3V08_14240 [Nannocystaceae bacterium]